MTKKYNVSLFISCLDFLIDRLQTLKLKNNDRDLLDNSIQQIAFCYAFISEKNLFSEYLEYVPIMEKQYNDFQVVIAHEKEIKDL